MNKMTTNAMLSVPHTMSALRGIHVETERDHEIRAQLQRLLQVDADGKLTPIPVRFTASRETRGIVLVEPAGGGKTTAIAEVLRNIHVLGNNPDTGAPHVVQASVESPATQKSLGIAIDLGRARHSPDQCSYQQQLSILSTIRTLTHVRSLTCQPPLGAAFLLPHQ